MQQRTDIVFIIKQPFPAGRKQGQLLVRRPRDEAIGRMIVHQSGGLHVGIDDRTADKSESALLEILGQRVALRARGRNL